MKMEKYPISNVTVYTEELLIYYPDSITIDPIAHGLYFRYTASWNYGSEKVRISIDVPSSLLLAKNNVIEEFRNNAISSAKRHGIVNVMFGKLYHEAEEIDYCCISPAQGYKPINAS